MNGNNRKDNADRLPAIIWKYDWEVKGVDYKTRKKGAKRVLVFLLAFMMLVMQIPATVWAQEDTGVKSVSSPDAEDYGSGKITDNTVSGSDLPGADAEAQDVSGNLLMKLKAGAQAGETTYYVDAQNGDDNNDGKSEEKAFRSLDKVNEMTFLPGDRILLKKGCIWNGQLKPGGNGTEELPIIISSYGEGSRPVINGNGTGASLTESDNRSESMEFFSGAVQLVNQSFWEISGLEVTNNAEGYSSNRSGILIFSNTGYNQKHIYVRDCYVHDCYPTSLKDHDGTEKMNGGIVVLAYAAEMEGTYSGGKLQNIFFRESVEPGFTDVRIEGNYVKNVAKEGIRNKITAFRKSGDTYSGTSYYPKTGRDIVFRNNYIENVYGDAIVLSEVGAGGLVENNIIKTHTQTNTANYAACWAHYCDDALFQYNEVFDGRNAYNDGEAFDIDNQCDGVVFQYNYSHNNYGGFMLVMGPQYNSTIRYNVTANDGYGLGHSGNGQQIFYYDQDESDLDKGAVPAIYNNTIYTGKGVTTSLFDYHSKLCVNFNNNIVLNHGNLKEITSGNMSARSTIRNNCFYPANMAVMQGRSMETLLRDGNLFTDPRLAAPQKAREHDSLSYDLDGADTSTQTLRDRIQIFKLRDDSPMIDAGISVDGAPQEDIFGNKITGTPDIGAHEYSNDPSAVEEDDTLVPVSIVLNQNTLELDERAGFQLTAQVLPEELLDHSITYTSSDSSVAAVSLNGRVTACAGGTAVIRAASSTHPSVYAECRVTVKSDPSRLTITPDADAYVRDNGTQSGTEGSMTVKKDAKGYNRKSYIRFEFPENTELTGDRIQIKLFATKINSDSDARTISVYGVDNNWDENTITWESVPGRISEKITDVTLVPSQKDTWITIDITDYIMENIGSQKAFSFELVNESPVADSGSDVIFNTKEAEENQPYLTYRAEDPNHHLVLYSSFDNGDARDETGRGNDGKVNGGIEFVEGVKGKAVKITNDRSSSSSAPTQYINYGKPADLTFGDQDFSISFWYKSVNNGAHDRVVLGNKDYANGSNKGFAIGTFNATNQHDLRVNFAAVQGSRIEIRDIPSNNDEWHQLTATFDREGSMCAYLDGVLVEQTSLASQKGVSIDVADFVVGADGYLKWGVTDAIVDELRVYKEALPQSYAEKLYQADCLPIVLEKMEQTASEIKPDSQYTRESIDGFLEDVKAAAEKLSGLDVAGTIALYQDITAKYEKFLDGQEPEFSFTVISDVHVTDSSMSSRNTANLIRGLNDMKSMERGRGALVSLGDQTQNGTEAQVKGFYQALGENQPMTDDRVLVALGNHDVRGSSTSDWAQGENNPYWETAYPLYMQYNQKYMGETDGKTYFDRWIDGYHFIMLNTEKALKDSAYLSEEQLKWLEEKLAEKDPDAAGNAEDAGNPVKPVFVCIHQALNDSHYRSDLYKGFGDADEQVKEILRDYPQAVFLSGHIHNGFGVASVIDREYGTLVDVPSFNESENGYVEAGSGYQVNIYPDKIQLRARNFATSQWLPQYDVNIALESLPALYQKASGIDQEQYTQESYQQLKNSMEAAEELFALRHEHFTDSSNVPAFVPVFTKEIRNKSNDTAREMAAAIAGLKEEGTVDPDPDKPGTEDPDKPGTEDPDKPGTEDPDKPGTEEPDKPGTEDPEQPGTEDPDKPGTENPEQPGTNDPSDSDSGSGDEQTSGGTNSNDSDSGEVSGSQDNQQIAAVSTNDRIFAGMVIAVIGLAAGASVVVSLRKKK